MIYKLVAQRAVAAKMMTVIRNRPMTLLWFALVLTACVTQGTALPTNVDSDNGVPTSLDGLWILEDTDLNLDIQTANAQVDGRTGCARLLGSLTFIDGGQTASFSLPGREDRGCTAQGTRDANQAQDLLETVASATPEVGGYRLFDAEGEPLGRLLAGS